MCLTQRLGHIYLFVVALLADFFEGLGGCCLGLFCTHGIAAALVFASLPAVLPPGHDGVSSVLLSLGEPRQCRQSLLKQFQLPFN